MKNFLFLSFLCLSFLSLGQEQTTSTEAQPQKVTTEKISKQHKIDKRIKTVRSKDQEVPKRENPPAKKD